MPDIGLLELVVIGLVLFLVVGPERMPELFAQVAGFIRKARAWMEDTKAMLRDQAQDLQDPLLQAKEVVRGEVESAADELTGDLSKELRELKEHGEVVKQRPLSEIYEKMQAQDADGSSQGFMQGEASSKRAGKVTKDDEG